MKMGVSIAVLVAAVMVVPATAKELKPEEAEEVLAKGEVVWANSERPVVAVRHRGDVFLCTVERSFDSQTSVRYADITCWDTER